METNHFLWIFPQGLIFYSNFKMNLSSHYRNMRLQLCSSYFSFSFFLHTLAITCMCFSWWAIKAHLQSNFCWENRRDNYVKKYKCNLLSCLQGKLLDGMTWKSFWRWNNYFSTNLLWFENQDNGYGVMTKYWPRVAHA